MFVCTNNEAAAFGALAEFLSLVYSCDYTLGQAVTVTCRWVVALLDSHDVLWMFVDKHTLFFALCGSNIRIQVQVESSPKGWLSDHPVLDPLLLLLWHLLCSVLTVQLDS